MIFTLVRYGQKFSLIARSEARKICCITVKNKITIVTGYNFYNGFRFETTLQQKLVTFQVKT